MVISVIAILVALAYANIGTLQEDQLLKGTASDVQSVIRLAQSNATSRLKCGGLEGANWLIEIANDTTLNLKCSTQVSAVKSLNFPSGIHINSITKSNGTCPALYPVTINYSALFGDVSFSDLVNTCFPNTMGVTLTLESTKTNDTKLIKIDKGGSVDVN